MKSKNLSLNLLYSVFLLGLLACPFVFWPTAFVAFEIPKVWFFNRFVEILAIFSLFLFPYVSQKSKHGNFLTLLIILFVLISFTSSLLGQNFSKSFWGNYYRGDGLYTLIHLVILFLFVKLTGTKIFIEKSSLAITYSGIGLSIISLALFIFHTLFNIEFSWLRNWGGAYGGPFGNPNFLSGYLIVILPFALASFRKQNLLRSFSVLVLIAGIMLTKAWAGIFGLLIFFICYFLFKNKKTIFLSIFFTAVLIFLGVYFYKESPGVNYSNSFAAESRQRIFAKGLIAFSKKPLIGWGWANFDYAFDAVDWPVKYYNDVYVDKAHSHLLEILVTTGITGLTVYLLIILKVFLNLIKLNSPYKLYFLISFILFWYHSQTNIISISEEIIFWYLAGVSTIRT